MTKFAPDGVGGADVIVSFPHREDRGLDPVSSTIAKATKDAD
jgi:hypothetical protein